MNPWAEEQAADRAARATSPDAVNAAAAREAEEAYLAELAQRASAESRGTAYFHDPAERAEVLLRTTNRVAQRSV